MAFCAATATANVNGNVVDICPSMPPLLGGFTVSGTETNGWTLPDPGYPMPALNMTSQTWSQSDYDVVRSPGTWSRMASIFASWLWSSQTIELAPESEITHRHSSGELVW